MKFSAMVLGVAVCVLNASTHAKDLSDEEPVARVSPPLAQLEIAVEASEKSVAVRTLKDGDGTIVLEREPAIRCSTIKEATAMHDQHGWSVTITLSPSDRRKFHELTKRLAGKDKRVALILDGKVLIAPQVREPIPGGTVRLTGGLTAVSAREIASQLRSLVTREANKSMKATSDPRGARGSCGFE